MSSASAFFAYTKYRPEDGAQIEKILQEKLSLETACGAVPSQEQAI
jgi:hypothetical protein